MSNLDDKIISAGIKKATVETIPRVVLMFINLVLIGYGYLMASVFKC